MKYLLTILLFASLTAKAQLYVSPRYDHSFNPRTNLEIGRGDITQRAALVIAQTTDKNIDMMYIGARGYQTVASFWDRLYLQLYVGGFLSVTKNLELDLNGGMVANIKVNQYISLQGGYGFRSNDSINKWGYPVTSGAINFYFK